MKSNIKLICLMVIASMVLNACKKSSLEVLETITSAEDNATAESEFASAFDLGDDIASTDSRLKKAGSALLPSGAVLNITDSLFTDGDGKAFDVDFGPLGTAAPFGRLCADGRYRSGKIHFTLSGPYATVGSVLVIELVDADKYFCGNGSEMTQITGTKTITRTQSNQFTVQVSNGKAINSRGTVQWQANRSVTRTKDAGPGLLGDVFEITGNASGTNRDGERFTVSIDLPLKKKVEPGCAQTFIKGKLTLRNLDSGKEIKIDYDPFGNEACDRTAKATINGKDRIFTVR